MASIEISQRFLKGAKAKKNEEALLFDELDKSLHMEP